LTDTVIGLLRHGQTDWNIDFRLQGITDTYLNEVGIAQANTVGKLLKASDWDVLLASPLIRAKDTAAIVAEHTGMPAAQIEPLLLERSFGEAEGMTHDEWKAAYPNHQHVPGGETLDELSDRAWLLLDTLVERYAGQRVLTVSHGALIRKLINHASEGELPREGERLGNASLNLIAHDGKKWRIVDYWLPTYEGQAFSL
jgi:uncharacterized phosphatase